MMYISPKVKNNLNGRCPMAEKNTSLADQAYETIKNNILNLTYPSGMPLTEAFLTK